MEKITDKIIELIFDKVWVKIIMPIIYSLIAYYLALTSKHPILHDPAVLFVICLVVVAATLVGMMAIQNFLEKKSYNKSINLKLDTCLVLYFYGDSRAPSKIEGTDKNIFRWYWLRNGFVYIDKQTEERKERTIPNLYVNFDNPINAGTLEVKSPDIKLPIYEVKELTNRYAIIVFHDDLPRGEIHITVK